MRHSRTIKKFPPDIIKEAVVYYYNEALKMKRPDCRENEFRLIQDLIKLVDYSEVKIDRDGLSTSQHTLPPNILRAEGKVERFEKLKEMGRL